MRRIWSEHSAHANVAPFQMTDIPNWVVEHLQLDFCGPFQAANTHPFRYALQIQDVLTRFVMFVPCINDSSETAAKALMNQWVCLFGVPEVQDISWAIWSELNSTPTRSKSGVRNWPNDTP